MQFTNFNKLFTFAANDPKNSNSRLRFPIYTTDSTRVREANVYCEIIPFNKEIDFSENLKGIILSGSPFSVNETDAPVVDIMRIHEKVPVLGICYGAQLIAKLAGGSVEKSDKREYGRSKLQISQSDQLLKDVKMIRMFG